ncbi:IclR family transcriptional regulator [Maritalea sp.]|uniref:IclR family transcriptional regulator n=1 Tax=Maritalea sp. TaxID=2003361 RepID=UPI003EF0BF60
MEKQLSSKVGKGSVQSLNRALGLLQLLSEYSDGLPLSELAPLAELAPSTAHRLLSSLQALDFVSFETESNKWFVGVAAFRVGAGYLRRRDHIATAREMMRQLVRQTGETSNLAVIRNRSLTFVGQIECEEAMRMAVPLGARGPLHASAVGKSILAFMSQQEQADILANIDYPALTSKSHQNASALKKDLMQVRALGFAMDDEEQSDGLRCIGAPIFDEFGEPIFAVSISGPTVRVTTQRVNDLAQHVKVAAGDITDRIGGIVPADYS